MKRLLSVVGVILAILEKRALRVFLPIVSVLVFSCAVQAATVTRIMPLGDSITRGWWGSAYSWGYRKPLYGSLTSCGYSFDFVGSQVDGSFPDPQHEGHDGWRTDQILSNVNGWLIAYYPDIVLLHIGTNDITQGYHDANQVNYILNAIDAYEINNNKHVTVVLALMINRRIDSPAIKRSQTTQFNSDVNNIAQNRIANGDDIIVVDMESALNYNIGVDMADEVHPNDNGYVKMAAVWYNALADYVLPLEISGYVREADGNEPMEGVLILVDGNDVCTSTDANGHYELLVYRGWSGVVAAQKDGCIFEPSNFSYTNVNHNYANMNYAASLMTFKISGFVFEEDLVTPVSDVNVSADNGGGSAITDADGYYEIVVGYNWSGNVTPGRYAYGFEPNSRHYENVEQNYTEGQDYTGNEFDFKITGCIRDECNAPVEGVLVDANNGGSESITDADGFYEVWVDSAWSGVVTPSRQHYTFEPNQMSYIEVFADQTDQNYSAHNIYDLDRDGFVGWSDFDIMTKNWLLTGPESQGDFVVDGTVNFLDIADFERIRQGR
jgi:hypothetical protein